MLGPDDGDSLGDLEGDWVVGDTLGEELGLIEGDLVAVVGERLTDGDKERLGDAEGLNEGDTLGDLEGLTDGDELGGLLGLDDGFAEGDSEGDSLGDSLGFDDGLLEGDLVGVTLGDSVGLVVGLNEGDFVGVTLGDREGDFVGETLGDWVGLVVGLLDGDCVGDVVGCLVGAEVGGFVITSNVATISLSITGVWVPFELVAMLSASAPLEIVEFSAELTSLKTSSPQSSPDSHCVWGICAATVDDATTVFRIKWRFGEYAEVVKRLTPQI